MWMEPVNPLSSKQDVRLKMPATTNVTEVTLYLVASNPSQLTFDGPVPPAFFTAVFTRWPSTLEEAPTEPIEQTVRVYLGRAEADGRVVPTQPA